MRNYDEILSISNKSKAWEKTPNGAYLHPYNEEAVIFISNEELQILNTNLPAVLEKLSTTNTYGDSNYIDGYVVYNTLMYWKDRCYQLTDVNKSSYVLDSIDFIKEEPEHIAVIACVYTKITQVSVVIEGIETSYSYSEEVDTKEILVEKEHLEKMCPDWLNKWSFMEILDMPKLERLTLLFNEPANNQVPITLVDNLII